MQYYLVRMREKGAFKLSDTQMLGAISVLPGQRCIFIKYHLYGIGAGMQFRVMGNVHCVSDSHTIPITQPLRSYGAFIVSELLKSAITLS